MFEAVINGTVVPQPVQFTRADTVTFRVKQQDTKGKTLTVTKADWTFRSPADSVTVTSATVATPPKTSVLMLGLARS